MNRIAWFTTMVLLAVFTTVPFILTIFFNSPGAFFAVTSGYFFDRKASVSEVREIRIVGDIMLGRHVEMLMRRHGAAYPYQYLETEPDVAWVGNFEATVGDTHIPTPNYEMQFSVDKKYLPALREAGFTHLSLANNHSYDFGPAVYEETMVNLEDFTAFGHPRKITEDSTAYIELGDTKVGMLALNYTQGKLDPELLSATLYKLGVTSDVQIAYIHWGNEYEPKHHAAQEQLAHTLIDGGIDMVIGHHPHVVQDIAQYKGKPIFYSLGNFIFDQYFEPAVKEGLMVSITVNEEDELSWDLMPVSAHETAAAPRIMAPKEREVFLRRLAERSDPSLFLDILEGSLTFAY